MYLVLLPLVKAEPELADWEGLGEWTVKRVGFWWVSIF